MMKRKLKKLTIVPVLLSIFLFIAIAVITAADVVLYHTPGYFENYFIENEVVNDLNRKITIDDVVKSTDCMMEYLRGNRKTLSVTVTADNLPQPFFSEKEILHLRDVRKIFLYCFQFRRIAVFVFLTLLAFLFSEKTSRRQYLYLFSRTGFHVLLCLFLIGGISFFLVLNNFDHVFITFHKLLFDNDFWILNPQKDDLINLLHRSFFISTTKRIIFIFSCIIFSSEFILMLLSKRFPPKQKTS